MDEVNGSKRAAPRPSGHIRDSVYYSITDDEWPAVRVRLRRLVSDRPGSTSRPS